MRQMLQQLPLLAAAQERVRAVEGSKCTGDAKRVKRLRGELSSELTRREKQIVLYLCLGLKEAAVARELGICPATVHSHITRVHRKLDVSSRGLLVAIAIVRGVICVDELAELLNGTSDCGVPKSV